MYFTINRIFLAYFYLAIAKCSLVGPRKWLRRLTNLENNQLLNECYTSLVSESNILDTIIVTKENHASTACTGIPISPRHILTLKQCFDDVKIIIQVCKDANCLDSKQTLSYDFAIFDNSLASNLAIIQLKENQDNYVCLPTYQDAETKMKLQVITINNAYSTNNKLSEILGDSQADTSENIMIDLRLYLDDFCGYLGLCAPSSDGLYKLLNLNSVYFPEIKTKPDMAPFRPVADNYAANDCKERENASLVDDNQQVVCDNVMWVSSQHLVTTRDCLSNLKPWLSKVAVLRLLISTNTDYLVEFVAWSSTHTIAIVQLIGNTEQIVCLPSSISLKPFLGSFCIYLNLCSNQQHLFHNSLAYFNHFFYSSTQSVGPKNWLVKLNDEEQANYTKQCISPPASVQNRIVGGEVAKQGQFPFAAVLLHKTYRSTKCGASIISPWHILTARHCIIDGNQNSFDIMIGGVCYSTDIGDCAQVDMIEIGYEFVIFDSIVKLFPSYGDFAIIQLKQKIPEHFFASGMVDFVCLSQQQQNPELLQSIGWGIHTIVNKKKGLLVSEVLRYVTIKTWNDPWFNSTIFIATKPPSSRNTQEVGTLPGDSGGPAVVYSERLKKFILYGILNNGLVYDPLYEGVRDWFLKISIFTDDFCFYLNICYSKPTKDLKPVLAMGGTSFSSKKRHSFKSLPPFELISEKDRHKILEDCKLMQQQNRENDACALNLPWNAALVNGNGESLCALTFVTYKHLITNKDCILANLQSAHLTVLSQNKQLFEIDFIAWSYAHSIVIIQLKNNQDVTPVCFKGKPTNLFRSPQNVVHSITDLDKYPDKKEICKQDQYLCVTRGEKCNENVYLDGHSVISLSYLTLEGIKLKNPWSSNDLVDVYLKTKEFSGALCIYINLCGGEKLNFHNPVSYFTSFYYLNK